ncbi:hypothetical protein Moror_54 [Moniliophthora roreri MCA 2997]|uniref:Uncharacterized protein n=1 Tax=Moniliophthora roreri (strain MCA 2997) TaxID=1381753 RepID=V2Z2W3_MONRO|nr:hypothetical protein Moror_54 [Moniliophthora roreri MCA 2997]
MVNLVTWAWWVSFVNIDFAFYLLNVKLLAPTVSSFGGEDCILNLAGRRGIDAQGSYLGMVNEEGMQMVPEARICVRRSCLLGWERSSHPIPNRIIQSSNYDHSTYLKRFMAYSFRAVRKEGLPDA